MSGDDFGTLRLAAIQAAPVLLDREASIEKACRLIRDAGEAGADVVGFPEGFIPGHPLWFHFHPSSSAYGRDLSRQLVKNAVTVPSAATAALCAAARDVNAFVVIGICEKEPESMGTLFNSLLFINGDGQVLGVRRKLVPTGAERILHTAAAGDSVRVFGGPFGPVAGLMCGENSNPLLTFAMQALGARVHVASWPSFFSPTVDMRRIADVACQAIAYQNACFVISAFGAVDSRMMEVLPLTAEDRKYLEAVAATGGSSIYAPGGEIIGGPVGGGERIVYADAAHDRISPAKIIHDYAGDYNRFDIFQLHVSGMPAPPSLLARDVGSTEAGRPSSTVLPLLRHDEVHRRPEATDDAAR
jgi:nitrilase